MKKVSLLGAGGFIGSHLIKELLSKDTYFIEAVDINSTKIEDFLKHPRINYSTIDINDLDKVTPIIKNSDHVVLLAAICNPSQYNTKPLDVIEINFFHAMKIIELCSSLNKPILSFSTSEVYGRTLGSYIKDKVNLKLPENKHLYELREDESPLIMGPIHNQRWIYASAKELLERIMFAYGEEGRLHYSIVRPFNFIGPQMDFLPGIEGEGIPRVLACFVSALLRDENLELVDGGENLRVFTDIRDAVKGIVKIIEKPLKSKNQIFNIGNPENEISIKSLAVKMKTIYEEISGEPSKSKITTVSSLEFYGKGYEDSDRRVPIIDKATKILNWSPEITLDECLKETLKFYYNKYKK